LKWIDTNGQVGMPRVARECKQKSAIDFISNFVFETKERERIVLGIVSKLSFEYLH